MDQARSKLVLVRSIRQVLVRSIRQELARSIRLVLAHSIQLELARSILGWYRSRLACHVRACRDGQLQRLTRSERLR